MVVDLGTINRRLQERYDTITIDSDNSRRLKIKPKNRESEYDLDNRDNLPPTCRVIMKYDDDGSGMWKLTGRENGQAGPKDMEEVVVDGQGERQIGDRELVSEISRFIDRHS